MRAVIQGCSESQIQLLHEGLTLYPDGAEVGVTLQRAIELEIDRVDTARRRQRAGSIRQIYQGGLPGTGK